MCPNYEAPALAPKKPPPAILKWLAINAGNLFPRQAVDNTLELKGLSRDQAVIDAYLKDPYVHPKISFRLGKDIFEHADMLMKNRANFKYPVLCLHPPLDLLTSFDAAKTFFDDSLGSTDKTFKPIDEAYHECTYRYI
jgi:alpha-beta hydrolase superfamily lysophospholipase